ncbi:MAG: putative ABC transporter permease [Bacilli bacterium]|nr:putative ABC transporter permease [Bacilli bacterium]
MKRISFDSLKRYYLIFMMYAVIGWIYEVFLEVVVYRWGFSNRGVLFGPYCPVYGVGALLFIFLIYPIIKNKSIKTKVLMIPIIFVLCALLATALELITSYLCEFFLGSWPWQTYADYKYNFQARVALSPSIRFGIGGVVFLYLLEPVFERVVNKINSKKLNILFWSILIIFIIDLVALILKSIF